MSTLTAQSCSRPAPRRRRRGLGAATAVVLAGMLVTACEASDGADGSSGDQSGSAAAQAAVGTRGNPVPAGTPTQVGSWTVAVAPAALDATDTVLAENQFNSPPADGRQFVLTEMSVTLDSGDEAQTPWVSLSVRFIGSDGNTYGTGTDDYCGVVPASLSNLGEMYTGASAAGNVCVSVPSTAVEGGTWSVEESFSFSGSPVFFALS